MNRNSSETIPTGSQIRWINLIGPLLFILVIGLFLVRAEMFRSVPGQIDNARLDYQQGYRGFHNGIYYPARAFVSGVNPYSVEYEAYHPDGLSAPLTAPSSLLLHLYLGFLNLQTAEIVYLCISLALLIFIAWFSVRDSSYPFAIGAVFFVAAAMLVCRPGMLNLFGLQMTLMLVAGTLMALEYADKSPALSGFGLLLACCKPTFAIPLAISMLFRRNFSAFALGVLFCGLANAAAIWHIGTYSGNVEKVVVQGTDYYSPKVLNEELADVEMVWGKLDLYSVSSRWADFSAIENLIYLIPICVLVFGAFITLMERNPNHRSGVNSRTGLFAMLIMLACVYHEPQDALVLGIPLAALLLGHQKLEMGINPFSRFLIILLMLIPMFNFLTTRWAMNYLEVDSGLNSAPEGADLMVQMAHVWPWKLTVTINGIAIALAAIVVAFSILGSWNSKREYD